jgi:hypothetical protein
LDEDALCTLEILHRRAVFFWGGVVVGKETSNRRCGELDSEILHLFYLVSPKTGSKTLL